MNRAEETKLSVEGQLHRSDPSPTEHPGHEYRDGHYNGGEKDKNDWLPPPLAPVVKMADITEANLFTTLLTSPKKYYCHMCKLRVTNRKHKRVHFRKIYECRVCGKVYGRSDNLGSHIKAKHNSNNEGKHLLMK